MPWYSRRRFCNMSGATLLGMCAQRSNLLSAASLPSALRGHYINPIVPGDHPDAGAIRVGSDYYLTHTSFRYTPGLVIWHSRNLVDWAPVSAALHRFIGDVWAPYLCQHGDQFLIYFPVNGRLFVVHASKPEGPWSEPIDLKLSGIDPAHLGAADGRRYLYFAGGQMIELSADGLSTVGTSRKTFEPWHIPESWSVECECLEAPKVLQKGDYYYLTVAEGGTSGPPTSHMVISMRSKDPSGPWEFSPFNPILHTSNKKDFWWSVGHGRLVEAVDGSWWMTCHAYENGYRSLGRQNLLVPVEWTESGWYRVSADIAANAPISISAAVNGKKPELSDDFSGNELRLQWQFFNSFNPERASLNSNTLTLAADGTSYADTSVMACIAGDHSYTVEIDIEIEPGCEAGLVLFYNQAHAAGLTVGSKGVGFIRNGARTDLSVSANRATFRLVNDQQDVDMYYRLPGQAWVHVRWGIDITSYNDSSFGGFLDVRPALYAAGANYAKFRSFVYSPVAIVPTL